MELKLQKDMDGKQIDNLKDNSVDSTIMFGIAFSGKEVIVKTDRISTG